MPEFLRNKSVLVFLKRAGNNYSVAGLFQGKYDIEYGEVKERNGKRTSIDKFISRIEAAKPAPTKSPETPGFGLMTGFLGLLVGQYILKRLT